MFLKQKWQNELQKEKLCVSVNGAEPKQLRNLQHKDKE
jgi:hypothetical protein